MPYQPIAAKAHWSGSADNDVAFQIPCWYWSKVDEGFDFTTPIKPGANIITYDSKYSRRHNSKLSRRHNIQVQIESTASTPPAPPTSSFIPSRFASPSIQQRLPPVNPRWIQAHGLYSIYWSTQSGYPWPVIFLARAVRRPHGRAHCLRGQLLPGGISGG